MSSDPVVSVLPASVEPILADGRVLLDATTLKTLRKQLGLSQETLAHACLNRQLCVSIASIKRAETGKPVLYRTARHLAMAFDVDIHSLLAQADTLPAPPQEPEQDRQGVRYVLALCVDAESSAALVRGDDLTQRVQQFGGVPCTSGHGSVIAHFGTPLAYRSDSERGLLCALAMRDAALLAPSGSIFLRLVCLDELHHLAPISRAALPAGEGPAVYVPRELVEQLAPLFEFGPAPVQQSLWQPCLSVRAGEPNAPRQLVGRAVEILQFKALLEATQECQDGHVVYVRGMAGIGKSRLVTEFIELARQDGFACHRGDVLDFGMGDVYWPLGQLVRSLLGMASTEATLDEARLAALGGLHLGAEQCMFLQVLMGQHDSSERFALYAGMTSEARVQGLLEALRELLLRLAVQRPLLLCMEDLHWGEPALFALLGRLLEATNEAPVLWLLTSRHEDDPLDSALRPGWSMPMSLLDIAALRPREAAALADQFVQVEPGYRADCVARAQGNPLYLTQLLASQEGVFPHSLRHLVQSRFDRLVPEQRRALRYASVFGNRFELAMLREVLGQADYLPEPGMRHSLLREAEPGHYVFVHDLVMHCIYDALPASLREQLHLEVAGLWQHRDPALYAQHLLRADDPQAFDAMLAAMQHKWQACQYEAVLAVARQCEHFAERARASFRLAWLRGQANTGLGRIAQACTDYQQALQLAGDATEQLEAVLALAPALNLLDRLDEEEHLIRSVMPLAESLKTRSPQAWLLHLQGNICFPRGDYVRCRQLHEKALACVRTQDEQELCARALSGIGDSWYAQGHMRKAFEVFDQCVQLCEQHGLAHIEAINRSARASTQLYLGHTQQAVSDAERAVAGSQRMGNHRAEVFSRLTLAWGLLAMGREQGAEPHLLAALEQARRLGARRFEALLLEGLARVALHRQQHEQARTLMREAVQLVDDYQLQLYIGPWIYASMALVCNEMAQAWQMLERGQEWLEHTGLAHNALRFRVTAAEICLLAGDMGQADAHARALLAMADFAPCAWIEYHTRLISLAGDYLRGPDSRPALLDELLCQGDALGLSATMPTLGRLLAR